MPVSVRRFLGAIVAEQPHCIIGHRIANTGRYLHSALFPMPLPASPSAPPESRTATSVPDDAQRCVGQLCRCDLLLSELLTLFLAVAYPPSVPDIASNTSMQPLVAVQPTPSPDTA
eukprot:2838266-Rhodomonas_salina.2